MEKYIKAIKATEANTPERTEAIKKIVNEKLSKTDLEDKEYLPRTTINAMHQLRSADTEERIFNALDELLEKLDYKYIVAARAIGL